VRRNTKLRHGGNEGDGYPNAILAIKIDSIEYLQAGSKNTS
jgi:hypothetical protein